MTVLKNSRSTSSVFGKPVFFFNKLTKIRSFVCGFSSVSREISRKLFSQRNIAH